VSFLPTDKCLVIVGRVVSISSVVVVGRVEVDVEVNICL